MKPVDDKLERLRRRKLLNLKRRMMSKTEAPVEKVEPEERSPREVLDRYFIGRAWEIFDIASAQFPSVMPKVEEALVEAIKMGKIKQHIDGESLFHFLRQLGLPVRLKTTIKYKEHGELKSINQMLREKK